MAFGTFNKFWDEFKIKAQQALKIGRFNPNRPQRGQSFLDEDLQRRITEGKEKMLQLRDELNRLEEERKLKQNENKV